MEALILALALFAVQPAPCPNPACYCRVCECDACDCHEASGVAAKAQPFGNPEELPVEIIDIWATYCPPCMAMKPDYEAVSREFPGLMKSVDAEANAEWVASKGVRTIPAILVMQGDKVLARYVGRMNREQLRAVARRWKE
jgi:thioredoxin 1